MAYSDKDRDDIFESICKRIEDGESLRKCLKDKDTPSSETFYKWLTEDGIEGEKTKRYAYACEERQEALFEEILEIADTSSELITKKKRNDAGKVIEEEISDNVNHRKLQIDSRKWMLGKLNPKKFGDRQIQEHQGQVTNLNVKLTKEEMKEINKALEEGF